MNTRERAEWQTNEVELWIVNDEGCYTAMVKWLKRGRRFNASSAKRLFVSYFGNCTPMGDGISRVRWGEVAKLLNTYQEGDS